MITAVDTNVLLDLLNPDDRVLRQEADLAIDACQLEGPLIVSPVVFAELALVSQRLIFSRTFLQKIPLHSRL